MLVHLEPRPEPSRALGLLSAVVAIGLTLIAGGALMAAMGRPPLHALYVYFFQPFEELWLWLTLPADQAGMWFYTPSEVVVKAIPLALIGAGLAVCFRANVWNIGAAGQYTLGAILGGCIALSAPEDAGRLWLIPYLAAGVLAGMAWAAIPAFLRVRFNANEILVSLMLTYVAALLLDFLVRGPFKDPAGYGFPESREFGPGLVMPVLVEGTRLHLGLVLALVACVALWLLMGRTLKGFEVRVIGAAPRAGAFAGFSRERTIWFVLLLSGGLAGLAGALEVSATVQQLQPSISAEYGFVAIIVAFLGRLNPLGALFGALILGVSSIGGENAQIALKLPKAVTGIFQGMLLFFLLGCDTLVRYRIRLARPLRA